MKRYRQLLFLFACVLILAAACAVHNTSTSLGKQKERTSESTTALEIGIEQMMHYTPEFTKGDSREHWSDSERAQLQAVEGRAVSVVGYINNLQIEDDGDIHLWIGKRDAAMPDRFIAEVTPYFRHRHSAWGFEELAKLKQQRTPIRVTGWPLWDELHPEELRVSRATLWEIHPITKLEENVGGSWVSLQ